MDKDSRKDKVSKTRRDSKSGLAPCSVAYQKRVVIEDCTIYLADCRELLPLLHGFDLILTDPPYDISAGAGGGCFGNRAHLVKTGGFTDSGCDYSFLSCVDNWFCFCSLKQLFELLVMAKTKGTRYHLLTWNKPNPVPTCCNKYLPDVEYIVHCFARGNLFGKYKDKSSFINYPCGNKQTDHPNEKPVSVINKLLTLGIKKGTVCDPFMGSGTTGVACARKGLQFVGIEREPKYFDTACKRIEDAYRTRPRLFECIEQKEPAQQMSLI